MQRHWSFRATLRSTLRGFFCLILAWTVGGPAPAAVVDVSVQATPSVLSPDVIGAGIVASDTLLLEYTIDNCADAVQYTITIGGTPNTATAWNAITSWHLTLISAAPVCAGGCTLDITPTNPGTPIGMIRMDNNHDTGTNKRTDRYFALALQQASPDPGGGQSPIPVANYTCGQTGLFSSLDFCGNGLFTAFTLEHRTATGDLNDPPPFPELQDMTLLGAAFDPSTVWNDWLAGLLTADRAGGDIDVRARNVAGGIQDINVPVFDGAATCSCGNGIIDSGEQCDDGNTVAGDACSPTCTEAIGISCEPTIPGCPISVVPNPKVVQIGDTVEWAIDASCDDGPGGPCAVAHPNGFTISGFFPDNGTLGPYGPETIFPGGTSPPTNPIPAPPPFGYGYTVIGSEATGTIILEGSEIPATDRRGLLVLLGGLLAGLAVVVVMRFARGS